MDDDRPYFAKYTFTAYIMTEICTECRGINTARAHRSHF